MWNRVAQGSRKLNYILSVSIVNPETDAIMERAMQQFNMAAVPPWPGKDFIFVPKGNDPNDADLEEMEAALALLGTSHYYTHLESPATDSFQVHPTASVLVTFSSNTAVNSVGSTSGKSKSGWPAKASGQRRIFCSMFPTTPHSSDHRNSMNS